MEQFEDTGNTSKSNYLCRQSSSRWIPTTDQIRILKDLYYNNGVRSPSAEQIQKISARLRQYGKIEGKNVFYWFQNHKARERQKKRFTADVTMQRGGWKGENSSQNSYCYLTSGVSSSSSPSVLSVGHMNSIGCCSSLVESNLKDCSISCNGSGFEWIGIGSTRSSYYTSLNSRSFSGVSPNMETLQLFPMHEDETSSLFPPEKARNQWMITFLVGISMKTKRAVALHHYNSASTPTMAGPRYDSSSSGKMVTQAFRFP